MLSTSLIEKYGAFITWLISSSLIFTRYLIFAGVAYLLFYVWQKKRFVPLKIQKHFPATSRVWYEVVHSIISTGVFGLFILLIIVMNSQGLTFLYYHIDQYSRWYVPFSFLLLVAVHDTYFYWTHRLMHHPKLFNLFHRVHHQSHNPTPWASFSFHPLEAIVEFAFLPIIVCCIPFHPLTILLWSLWMICWNVIGHLGFELFPKMFSHHLIFKWLNTSTHHNRHHQVSKGNYGLYFIIWDHWMGTKNET